ncbi:MAG: VWA domain-containing protein [Clostridia bacterium]|nr:VWA domain-containing protein [Clostridia bacterium]
MRNFKIVFDQPLLLLLLIPALFFTLLPYFRLSKRYRKTRNRITSMALHFTTMLLAICVLSGIYFTYEVPNSKNELILLVDVSDTENVSEETRDEFVYTVLSNCEGSGVKVGIVTFGYDQEYAVPMTDNIGSVYDRYVESLQSDLPDTSATNLASALRYTRDLFEKPENAKIVVITDGKETDEDAKSVIRSVSAKGIRVDTAYVASSYVGDDVQVKDITLPDYHVGVNEECSISVKVQSNVETSVTVTLLDNGTKNDATGVQTVDLGVGEHIVTFKHTFTSDELHELTFALDSVDLMEQNNQYSTYLYLQEFKSVLILEREDGESKEIVSMLNPNGNEVEGAYTIDIMDFEASTVPLTLDGLRKYDQVILNNISNPELKSVMNAETQETLDILLERYVREIGGGLLTVGGNDENDESNVYNQDTMYGSLYQQMLPVEAISYTPPVGVMIVVDVSGSMLGGSVGERPLDWAIAGALTCLEPDVLTERDYIGLMTLDTVYGKILPLTSLTQRDLIRDRLLALQDVEGGGTNYANALKSAAQELNTNKKIAKKHIIIVSDGGVGDYADTMAAVENIYNRSNVSISMIGIGIKPTTIDPEATDPFNKMLVLTGKGGGELSPVPEKGAAMVDELREELKMPVIEAINEREPFAPRFSNEFSPLLNGVERGEGIDENRMIVNLDAFYGVKKKEAAEVVLETDYGAPLYAQWKYGKGMVGSFMFDLKGNWSQEFISDESGKQFVRNVVKNLMPLEDIEPNTIRLEISEDNYTNQLSVYTTLKNGEYVKGEIVNVSNPELGALSTNEITSGSRTELRKKPFYVTSNLASSNRYSRCDFVVRESGLYQITVTKYNSDGEVIATAETFKTFSYSEEYDTALGSENDALELLNALAKSGNGSRIIDLEDPVEILDGFAEDLRRTFDPKLIMIILAIILFLLDIAVRKFKFKWPHELIREYKAKKATQNKENDQNK